MTAVENTLKRVVEVEFSKMGRKMGEEVVDGCVSSKMRAGTRERVVEVRDSRQ